MTMLKEKKLQGYKHKLLSFEKGEHKSLEVLEINSERTGGFITNDQVIKLKGVAIFKTNR